MALALILLAVGSVAAGYIGRPAPLGGSNWLGTWLAPVFEAPLPEMTGEFAHMAEAEAHPGAEANGHDGAHAADHEALELTLMGVSSAIALTGIGLAAFVWLRRRDIADRAARSLAPLHRLLLNKYYVDEVYEAVIVKPIHALSRDGLWKADAAIVDGAVNGVASIVASLAGLLRQLQTGNVRAYAGSLFVGVVLLLGYYFWR